MYYSGFIKYKYRTIDIGEVRNIRHVVDLATVTSNKYLCDRNKKLKMAVMKK